YVEREHVPPVQPAHDRAPAARVESGRVHQQDRRALARPLPRDQLEPIDRKRVAQRPAHAPRTPCSRRACTAPEAPYSVGLTRAHHAPQRSRSCAPASRASPLTTTSRTSSSLTRRVISCHAPCFDSALSRGCRSLQPCRSSTTR